MISIQSLKHDITEPKAANQTANSTTSSRAPSPNRGTSIADIKAIGPDRESKQTWLARAGIDISNQVKLTKLSHMRYQHPDLNEITRFLTGERSLPRTQLTFIDQADFGMKVVHKTAKERWYAGFGPDQYVYYAREGPKRFLGGAFEVSAYAELEKALRVPDLVVLSDGIEEMKDAPGGGFVLTFRDPEGFPVNLVFGQAAVDRSEKRLERLVLNDEREKPRQRAFQRFEPGPAEVFKLGHLGLNVSDFTAAMAWYTTHFNIVPSDILYVPSGGSPSERKQVAMFAHLNLGDTLTDHHTIFLTALTPSAENPHPTPHVHHCSFEVHDLDTQFLGHQWLAKKGYKSVWGVGRHILGSQIFDYWWDVHGFMVEHYADGDLVNMETPLAYGPAGHEGLAVWGPEVPLDFLE